MQTQPMVHSSKAKKKNYKFYVNIFCFPKKKIKTLSTCFYLFYIVIFCNVMHLSVMLMQ